MSLSGWIAGVSVLALIGGAQIASTQQNKLEPTGPPGPTMKTLDEIPPTWSQILPTAERFQLVMEQGEAVLDKETGLVWQREPWQPETWASASNSCYELYLGGRMGWRLPTVEELLSLMDPTAAVEPILPSGHPFNGIGTFSQFWTATTAGAGQKYVVRVNLAIMVGSSGLPGAMTSVASPADTTVVSTRRAWCVRGGLGYDGQ